MASPMWGLSGVATELGVTRQTVANWRTRYEDCPEPTHYLEHDGLGLWDMDGLGRWLEWHKLHKSRRIRPGPGPGWRKLYQDKP